MTANEHQEIAIVAMECKLPQVDDVDDFWQRLIDGEDLMTDLTETEMTASGLDTAQIFHPDRVSRAGVLDGVAEFDSAFFGYAPREADILDVQQRLMLEKCYTLLERANLDPQRSGHRVGVFVGSGPSTYSSGVLKRADLVETLGEMSIRHGNDKDFLATRISYKLDLRGPSVNVQTACSTGLVAVHTAVQSLLLDECDAAIAGAVHVRVPQHSGYVHQRGGVLSPDGVCRPFSSSANGTVFTNGLGVVLLKRLRDAVTDGDHVHAVIVGSAVNNDGSDKVSFTAPSVSGQRAVLREALDVAGLRGCEVSYIEAHGTGTPLGDPIEIEAIRQAYGESGDLCGIGSAKGNIGHTNIAAGAVSLIKAALVVEHEYVPATVNIDEVDSTLDLLESRFHIATEGRTLGAGDSSRENQWVGVSAFGMGGTNGHLILRNHVPRLQAEDAQTVAPAAPTPSIVTFSAKSESALRQQATLLAAHLAAGTAELAEYSHTLREGRARLPYRASLSAVSRDGAVDRLSRGRYFTGTGTQPLAFAFGGQGTQRPGMGLYLAERHARFADRLDEAVTAIETFTETDLEGRSTATEVVQPSIFAVEYALATALFDAAVRPNFLVGHSLGELVAATVAGVFDLETAAELVTLRGRFMSQCPPGAMLSVDRIEPFSDLLRDGMVTIAARNSPSQFVLAAAPEVVESIMARAREAMVHHRELPTSHAFHSPLMQHASDEFRRVLSSRNLRPPRISIVSNVTGQVLGEYEAQNPHYWAEHITRPVEFKKSIETLRHLGVSNVIEVGAGHSLSNLIRESFAGSAAPTLVQALDGAVDELCSFTDALALGWACDGEVDIDPYTRADRKVSVPVYPFARTVHWLDPVAGAPVAPRPGTRHVDQQSNDHAASNPPGASPPTNADGVDAATAEIRSLVREIFETFLGDSSIDDEQGFFDRGGNSLMAVNVIGKLRETFEVDVSVADFFDHSTVSSCTAKMTELLLSEAVQND